MVDSGDIVLGYIATIGYDHCDDCLVESSDLSYYKEIGREVKFYDAKIIGVTRDRGDGDIRRVYLISDKPIGNAFHPINSHKITELKGEVKYYQDERDYEWLGELNNYSGKYGRWLNPYRLHDVKKEILPPEKDGCNCRVCTNFFFMAAPDNQGDGKLTCYSCRNNPMRAYY